MSTGTESTAAAAGLRGVVAAQSSIGDVNGEEGVLIYQGYDIHDLAEHSTFEEVVFLLWNGRLPSQSELDEHTARLRRNYEAPTEVIDLMRQYPKSSNPMDVLLFRRSICMTLEGRVLTAKRPLVQRFESRGRSARSSPHGTGFVTAMRWWHRITT